MEFMGVAKGRKSAARGIHLEYSFDRLSERKIIQAYQLLIPARSWATSSGADNSKEPAGSLGYEAGCNLRTSELGTAEGRAHHREPDRGSHRACAE